MTLETPKYDRFLRPLFFLIALAVPVLAGYLVYFQWSMPALDCTVDWQTGTVLAVPPDSFSNYAGILPGDVLLTIDGVPFRNWRSAEIANRAVEVLRAGEPVVLEVPIRPYALLHLPHLLNGLIVALTFSGVGTFVVWRRYRQFVARLFFLMVQPIAVGLLLFLPFPDPSLRPLWIAVLSSTGFHVSGSLLVHYYLTFPVVLGNAHDRRRLLAVVYGLMPLALALRVSGTDWGLQLTFLYNTIEIMGAVGILVYVYARRATPDARRRLRLIVLGSLVPAIPSFFSYLVPTIIGAARWLPDWMVGPLIIISPLSYAVAIVRHDLFDIDRVLNRAAVYAIIAVGILLLYLGPFLLIYEAVPGDWLAELFLVAGLTFLVGLGFDWTRRRVQRWVDRLFYGGWYDYPEVVETISSALARSIERAELTDVLTRQVPTLMQLEPGQLLIGETSPAPPTPRQPRFPLVFQGQTRGVWVVGGHRDGEDFSADDLRILNTLAREAEVSLSNVLLVEMLRRQLDEIRASRETLAQAQRQLMSSREEERARLARDLHDGPIQELVGLNMQLGVLLANGNSPQAATFKEMRTEVRALLTSLRGVCAELRPPMLDMVGLGAALRVLADDWSSQSGIAVTLDLLPDASLRALPGGIAVNLYRLAQEALSNIARHAAAHSAHLRLTREGACLVLTIHDDGRGFAVPATFHALAASGHFGLVGMQERATLIGANWAVESAPGQGTTIRIAV